MTALEAATHPARVYAPMKLFHSLTLARWVAGSSPAMTTERCSKQRIYRKFESITFQTRICFESKQMQSRDEAFPLIASISTIRRIASNFTDWFQPVLKAAPVACSRVEWSMVGTRTCLYALLSGSGLLLF
jgi:hypothetical protein